MSRTTEIILRFNRPRTRRKDHHPRRWGSKIDWLLILASFVFCVAGVWTLMGR